MDYGLKSAITFLMSPLGLKRPWLSLRQPTRDFDNFCSAISEGESSAAFTRRFAALRPSEDDRAQLLSRTSR